MRWEDVERLAMGTEREMSMEEVKIRKKLVDVGVVLKLGNLNKADRALMVELRARLRAKLKKEVENAKLHSKAGIEPKTR